MRKIISIYGGIYAAIAIVIYVIAKGASFSPVAAVLVVAWPLTGIVALAALVIAGLGIIAFMGFVAILLGGGAR